MSGVLVLGSGGHGKVVATILLTQHIPLLGFLDNNPATWGTTILGLPVFGPIHIYPDFAPDGLVMGIGDNTVRQNVVQRLGQKAHHLWINAIHPNASVSPSVYLGRGIVIAAGAIVDPSSLIHDHVILNTASRVAQDCEIRNFAHIAPGSHLAGGITVGQGVLIGIGAAVTPDHEVGDWAVVGAGALVVRDVPASVTAKGVPARWNTLHH